MDTCVRFAAAITEQSMHFDKAEFRRLTNSLPSRIMSAPGGSGHATSNEVVRDMTPLRTKLSVPCVAFFLQSSREHSVSVIPTFVW
jgi:hypothetical protein